MGIIAAAALIGAMTGMAVLVPDREHDMAVVPNIGSADSEIVLPMNPARAQRLGIQPIEVCKRDEIASCNRYLMIEYRV